jgi:hypothetical protein
MGRGITRAERGKGECVHRKLHWEKSNEYLQKAATKGAYREQPIATNGSRAIFA